MPANTPAFQSRIEKSLCTPESLCCLIMIIQGHNDKLYIGITEHAFKTRFNNHSLSANTQKHSAKTTLSKYVWKLKARQVDFSIVRIRAVLSHLFLAKKFCILTADKSELISKCRHENKFSAENLNLFQL